MISAFTMSIDMFVLGAMIKIGSKQTGIVAAVCIFLYESLYTWGWVSRDDWLWLIPDGGRVDV